MSDTLIITFLYPDRPGRPPYPVTSRETFGSDATALDRADFLINQEERRRRKTPYKGPVLTDVRLKCADGTEMDYRAIRRISSPVVRD